MTDYAKHIARLERMLPRDGGARDEHESLTAAIELMHAAAPKSPEEGREIASRLVYDLDQEGNITAAIYRVERSRAAARAEGAATERALWRDERAQALADLETLRAALSGPETAPVWKRRCAELTEQLSAAQAEIERLRKLSEIDEHNARMATRMVRERDAEIERLRAENTSLAVERDTHMEAQQSRLADVHTAGVQSLTRQLAERDAEIERLQADKEGTRDALTAEIERLSMEFDQDHAMLVDVARALETKLTNLRTAAVRYRAGFRGAKDTEAFNAAIEASR